MSNPSKGWYLELDGTRFGPFAAFGFPEGPPPEWRNAVGIFDAPGNAEFRERSGVEAAPVIAWFGEILNGQLRREKILVRWVVNSWDGGPAFMLLGAWPVKCEHAAGRVSLLQLNVTGGVMLIESGAGPAGWGKQVEAKVEVSDDEEEDGDDDFDDDDEPHDRYEFDEPDEEAPASIEDVLRTPELLLRTRRRQRLKRAIGALTQAALVLEPDGEKAEQLARGYGYWLAEGSGGPLRRALDGLKGTSLASVADEVARAFVDSSDEVATAGMRVAEVTAPILFGKTPFDAAASEALAQAVDGSASPDGFPVPRPSIGPPTTLDLAIAGTAGNALYLLTLHPPAGSRGKPVEAAFAPLLKHLQTSDLDGGFVVAALATLAETEASMAATTTAEANWRACWRIGALEARTTLALVFAASRRLLPFGRLPSLLLLGASPRNQDLVRELGALLDEAVRLNLHLNAVGTRLDDGEEPDFAFTDEDVEGLASTMGLG